MIDILDTDVKILGDENIKDIFIQTSYLVDEFFYDISHDQKTIKIIRNNKENFNLIAISGFLYGILPTLPSCALEFASIPFLLGTLILFYRNSELKYLFRLFLYPFFSRFAVFGIFFCGYLLLFFFINWGVKKKPCWKMLIALLTLSAGYIFTEWRLFYIMLFSGEKNIHLMFSKQYLSVFEALQNSFNVFVYGQYHCGSLHTYIVLPVCLIFFVYINYIYIKNHALKKIFIDKFNWIMVWIILNCIIYGLAETEELWRLIDIIIPQLKGFGFERAIWMNPFLWYLAFMIVICRISKDIIKYFLLFLAFCILCLKPSMYNHIYLNLRSIAYEFFEGEKTNELTYGEFYSVNLFEKIKKNIGYDGEWSIAFGMHPAVLEYNGIATLDGYLSYYPSYYHSQFRKLIEPQLNIDEANANYYDRWGGRAYIFSDVVSTDPVKKMNVDSSVLNIDPDVFRELEGKYIFSRVAITNALDLGIKEVGVYGSEDSPYTIYVYELI